MDFEPGPFAVREDLPLGPRVFTPGRVLSLVADMQTAHDGVDQSLGLSHTTLASAEGAALAVPDGGAIADAANAAGTVVPGGDNDALASAVDGGVAIDEDGAVQQTALPGPDEDYPPDGTDQPIEREPEPPGGRREDGPPQV